MCASSWKSLFSPVLTIAAVVFVAASVSPMQAQQAQSLCPEGSAAASAVSVDRSVVRSFGRSIVIDVGGFDTQPPPETVCGQCALRLYPNEVLAYERTCVRITWEKQCNELTLPSEGAGRFPDRPDFVVCDWEEKLPTQFTESCLPIVRRPVP